MKFPPYRFSEYPKWVRLKNGADLLVGNRKEEIDAELDKGLAEPPSASQREVHLAKELAEAQALIVELRTAKMAAARTEAAKPIVGQVGTKSA